MKLDSRDIEGGVKLAILSGRLDIAGASEIDLPFNALAGSTKKLVVDLSDVSFIASIGIRTLVVGAKAIASKGGRMVLLNPQKPVENILRSSSIDTVIPIAQDQAEALKLVS